MAFLVVIGIFTILALIWSAIESRKPRVTVGAGMPAPTLSSEASAEKAMRDVLLASGKAKPADFETGALLFIHDGMTESEVSDRASGVALSARVSAENWSNGTGDEEDEADDAPPPTARELFREMLEAGQLEEHLEFLGTFYAPGPFDVYRQRRGRG